MPRPPKCRRVEFLPDITFFKPAGIPMRALEEVQMSVEEVEAIRLKDLEDLGQEEGARRMKVSRPTFQRVLASARRKMADALLYGKAIRIEGGSFEMASSRFKCLNGHEWEVPFEAIMRTPPRLCPVCNTSDFESLLPAGFRRRGRGWGKQRGKRSI